MCSTNTPLSLVPTRYSATWRVAPGGALCVSPAAESLGGASGRYPNSATARESRVRASYSPSAPGSACPPSCLARSRVSSFISATHPSFWIADSTSGTCRSKTPTTLGSASKSFASSPETKSRSSMLTSYTCAARAPRGSVAATRRFPPRRGRPRGPARASPPPPRGARGASRGAWSPPPRSRRRNGRARRRRRRPPRARARSLATRSAPEPSRGSPRTRPALPGRARAGASRGRRRASRPTRAPATQPPPRACACASS